MPNEHEINYQFEINIFFFYYLILPMGNICAIEKKTIAFLAIIICIYIEIKIKKVLQKCNLDRVNLLASAAALF